MRALSKPYIAPEAPVRRRGPAGEQSLAKELRRAYTEKYCESGALLNYADAPADGKGRIVAYKDLPDTEIAGYPYAIDRDGNGELRCHFPLSQPLTHEIVVGSTGCGKSTCCVEPRLRVLSSKGNQSSFFITDPKGELLARNAEHLRRQGYHIHLLNFRDVRHSDTWCPLAEIYDTWIQQKGLSEKLWQVNERKLLSRYALQDDPASYGETFWVFGEKAFSDPQGAIRCLEDERARICSETADLVDQVVHTLIPDTMLSKSDPSWFMGAQEILSGILYAMLEDALDPRSGFTPEMMNFMTVMEYFDSIRNAVMNSNSGSGLVPLLKTKKLMHKTEQSISIRRLRSYLENAPSTSRSYAGCLRNAMQKYFNDKIFTICSGNTVRMDYPDGRPVAIFLITRDYENTDYAIAGLFIDWAYRTLLAQAEEEHGALRREFVFLLDEFANIPAIRDLEHKITSCRSRNIWFHIFIQSYSQLDAVYGPAVAQTILDNCGSRVFLGSQNYETKARFVRECGKQTVSSLDTVMDPFVNKVIEIPLITVGRLENLALGQMYVKRNGMPLLLSACQPSFQCGEFREEVPATPAKLGFQSLPFSAEKYQYGFLQTDLSMKDYGRLRACREERAAQAPVS